MTTHRDVLIEEVLSIIGERSGVVQLAVEQVVDGLPHLWNHPRRAIIVRWHVMRLMGIHEPH